VSIFSNYIIFDKNSFRMHLWSFNLFFLIYTVLCQGIEVRIEANQRTARSFISFYELSETRRSRACVAVLSDCW
jgi:hypothetical protein